MLAVESTHLRTHIIRQKTAFLERNPVHAIFGDMPYSRFWLLRAKFELLTAKIYNAVT